MFSAPSATATQLAEKRPYLRGQFLKSFTNRNSNSKTKSNSNSNSTSSTNSTSNNDSDRDRDSDCNQSNSSSNSGSNSNGWDENDAWGSSNTPATINLARTTTTQNPLFAKFSWFLF